MLDDREHRRTLSRELRELREHPAWKTLSGELSAIRDALDRRILCLPLSQADNALRYTRHDLEREIRRAISNFLDMPDDLVARLE